MQISGKCGENMHTARLETVFSGDSFLYDYHYMWNQFRTGGFGSAEILWKDLVNLEEAGFDGYVNCQQTRVFAPAGFGMYVMAETLWNRTVPLKCWRGSISRWSTVIMRRRAFL